MNYFEEAERILRTIPFLEKSLENLKERERLLKERSGSSSFAGPSVNTTGYLSGSEVDRNLNCFCELQDVIRERQYTEEWLTFVFGVLEQLNKESREIVSLWYQKELSKDEICQKMYITSTTLYTKKNKAVQQFAYLYFGAKAL